MTKLAEILKKLLRDVVLFAGAANGLQLRRYQEAVARAVVHSVVHGEGLSFVVIFPRQSGKNELQAQLQAYLLTLFSGQCGEMVQISPTWRPQTENAMYRLERVLSANLVVKDRWEKHLGHIYQVGGARMTFLSGSPTANIVGATANLLLSIDEAQDIMIDKYDKEIAPMAASTNATRVFWGTAWTSNTLLAREYQAAKALQEEDGIQRTWRLTCDDVALEVPPYGKFVAEQVAKLGRQHPMVRTQYYSEDIDSEGGLFPPERLALLYGIHPPQVNPEPGQVYVMTLDLAGEDENIQDPEHLANPGRDATALTIARVNLDTLTDPGLLLPSYDIVYRRTWVGVKHTEIYGVILSMAATWAVKHIICDATGVGAGFTSFLTRRFGEKVIPFTFNSKTKSDLGWAFLALVDTGRLKTYAPDPQAYDSLNDLHDQFILQLQNIQFEIRPGPDKKIKWAVPEGARDLATGELIHDDIAISAAMIALCDQLRWSVSVPSAVVKAADPLDDMKGF
jgi:hypothetical protein